MAPPHLHNAILVPAHGSMDSWLAPTHLHKSFLAPAYGSMDRSWWHHHTSIKVFLAAAHGSTDKGWWHHNTSIKLVWSRPIAPWTGAGGHHRTSIKLFLSRPMAPWTSAAANECAAAQSVDPWAAIKKPSQECGGDTSSCPGPYPTAACLEFLVGSRLGRTLFRPPLY